MNFFQQFYLLMIFLLTVSLIPARGQDVLLYENPQQDTTTSQYGPNKQHFLHSYFNWGFVLGYPHLKGAKINHGSSFQYATGLRYKLKVNETYSLTADLQFNELFFNLRQSSQKRIPDRRLHESEKLNLNQLGLGLHNRINFGERGNFIGTFLDLGGYLNWSFTTKHIYKEEYKQPKLTGAEEVKVVNKNLTYIRPFNYGASVRLGYNRYVLYMRYRFSDLFQKVKFNQNRSFPELPRLLLGVQIGFHK